MPVQINTDQRARIALSPGSYGTGSKPGLSIVHYIGAKPDKTGATRHSFLVAALQASREEAAAFKAFNGSNPLDAPDYEGTAFFSLTLHEKWLNWESIYLAFSEASRNRDTGEISTDYVKLGIDAGDVTLDSISNARSYYIEVAGQKVLVANTPDEQKDAAILTQYGKELQQIAIKVGTLFRLIDWREKQPMSGKRDPNYDVTSLVGTEFSGKVTRSNQAGSDNSEVDSVYSMKK